MWCLSSLDNSAAAVVVGGRRARLRGYLGQGGEAFWLSASSLSGGGCLGHAGERSLLHCSGCGLQRRIFPRGTDASGWSFCGRQ